VSQSRPGKTAIEVEAYRKLTASLARINARSSPLIMRTLHF
jgi:hypothetical protein